MNSLAITKELYGYYWGAFKASKASPITKAILMRKIFIGISYGISWIIASLGLGAIINLGLIQSGTYENGDSAEIIVFSLVGLLAMGGAYSLYGEVFSKAEPNE